MYLIRPDATTANIDSLICGSNNHGGGNMDSWTSHLEPDSSIRTDSSPTADSLRLSIGKPKKKSLDIDMTVERRITVTFFKTNRLVVVVVQLRKVTYFSDLVLHSERTAKS